jgi:hypothetical protein
MVLSFIPEKRLNLSYDFLKESDRKSCPEESASFVSLITWWWFNG